MIKIEFTEEELDNLKMALVNSQIGWLSSGETVEWMEDLLKKIDIAIGEDAKEVNKPEYKYFKAKF